MRQASSRRATPADGVDVIVEQWHRERPDLDPSAKEITRRIVRLAGIFRQACNEAFAPLGISDGEFGALAALRRSTDAGSTGEPRRVTRPKRGGSGSR